MSNEQKDRLLQFLMRPKMFVPSTERELVVSFIQGFEAGADNRALTLEIEQILQHEFNIYGRAPGWPHAVHQYSKIKKLSWFEAFAELAGWALK